MEARICGSTNSGAKAGNIAVKAQRMMGKDGKGNDQRDLIDWLMEIS